MASNVDTSEAAAEEEDATELLFGKGLRSNNDLLHSYFSFCFSFVFQTLQVRALFRWLGVMFMDSFLVFSFLFLSFLLFSLVL